MFNQIFKKMTKKSFSLRKVVATAICLAVVAMFSGCTKDSNTLKVGVKSDVIGFGFKDPVTGIYSGLEIELAEMIADELGYDHAEFTTVTSASRTELLDAGKIDCVIATFTITEERKKNWDFSTSYFTDAVTVLVENASGITSLEDLTGKTIGVAKGSTSAFALVTAMAEKGLFPDYTLPETAEDFDVASFAQAGVTFIQFDDYPAISNALTAGTVDAFCVDKSILAAYKTDARSYINEQFAPQHYGIATKKGAALSASIETLITKWLSDGTINGLIVKYGIN